MIICDTQIIVLLFKYSLFLLIFYLFDLPVFEKERSYVKVHSMMLICQFLFAILLVFALYNLKEYTNLRILSVSDGLKHFHLNENLVYLQ